MEATRHLNALRMAETGTRASDEARVQKISRELERLVDAIVPADRVKGRMVALEAEKAMVEARLADRPAQEKPLLHPKMGEVYVARRWHLPPCCGGNLHHDLGH